jgi:hypothetical protein
MRLEQSPIPDWACRERLDDLAWIAENLDLFWAAATSAFEDAGRGAIVVDVTIQPVRGIGHPFGYFSREQIERGTNADTRRLVSEYDPTQELVVMLLKHGGRVSTYRLLAIDVETVDQDICHIQNPDPALRETTEENTHLLRDDADQAEAENVPSGDPALDVYSEMALQQLGEVEMTSMPELEPPDLETLMAWDSEGRCEAACPHHCWIEPDGTCMHGHPSWLLRLGLI